MKQLLTEVSAYQLLGDAAILFYPETREEFEQLFNAAEWAASELKCNKQHLEHNKQWLFEFEIRGRKVRVIIAQSHVKD